MSEFNVNFSKFLWVRAQLLPSQLEMGHPSPDHMPSALKAPKNAHRLLDSIYKQVATISRPNQYDYQNKIRIQRL